MNDNAVGKRETVSMYFFPVNCLDGRKDTSIIDLMSVIEKEIDSSDYVHQERPINWLQSYDLMKASKKPYFTLDEAKAVTRSFGVDDSEVPHLLSFFHDTGMLMWHEEPSLCNTVIMDPASFFIYPVTNVICKHEPDEFDDTVHKRQIHKDMMLRYGVDFMNMARKGIVTSRLMHGLLSESDGDSSTVVINLMLKFGFMSRMLSSSSSSVGDSATALSATYLVPSLLPICSDTGLSNRNQWCNNTFYFFFAISETLMNSKVMSWGEMEISGFLPSSLFQRLICKAVNWSQLTTVEKSSSSEFSLLEVYKDVAVLRYGSQKFQLTNLVYKNCISSWKY